MEQVVTSSVGGFFTKMCEELKSFKLTVWAKYLSMLCAIMMFFGSFGFRAGFWFGLLILILTACLMVFEFISCCKCFKEAKVINEKLAPLRAPLYKGCIYIVYGALYWTSGWFVSILGFIVGIFYIIGNFTDKKSDSRAPMV